MVEALVAAGVAALMFGTLVFSFSSSRDAINSEGEYVVATALANKYMSEIAVQSLPTKCSWRPPMNWDYFDGASDTAPLLPTMFPVDISINGVIFQTTIQWQQMPLYGGATTATGYYSAEFIVKVVWNHPSAVGATRKGTVSVSNAFRCTY